ncbi:hypothetical protein NIA71_15065 [Ihubacter massiliensis]|uniref:Uncharacterized protein n=1 Tax=Hominibacterium faecale TaxID=2839743 RepID=A0A9J6QNK4_9FIRM|nr:MULTISPECIES: hypothetical protein [Eubacteriales Family XIII. Incertae Sedis]MCO7123270.1 hypothetical protein [Ihubacter massiliensis]MCU7377530.1 hypothetical protein [Hominibacterium faecale]
MKMVPDEAYYNALIQKAYKRYGYSLKNIDKESVAWSSIYFAEMTYEVGISSYELYVMQCLNDGFDYERKRINKRFCRESPFSIDTYNETISLIRGEERSIERQILFREFARALTAEERLFTRLLMEDYSRNEITLLCKLDMYQYQALMEDIRRKIIRFLPMG